MPQLRLGDCRHTQVSSTLANPCAAGTTTQVFAQANLPCFLFNSNPHVTTVAYQAKIYPVS